MIEFITGSNWKWRFFTWNGRYALLKHDKQNEYKEYVIELIPSVFYTIKFYDRDREKPEEINDIDSKLYNKLKQKFFCPLIPIEKEDIINIALEVVNKSPMLRYSTLMGWTPYEDKTKDPNFFGGAYIFPDGNEYTITLHKGNLSVFPGHTDAVVCISTALPIVSKKINIEQWADRIYKDEKTIIKFE